MHLGSQLVRIAPLGNGASAEMLPYVLRDLCVDVVFVRLWCRTVFWFSLLIVLVLCCVHSELVQGASRKKKSGSKRISQNGVHLVPWDFFEIGCRVLSNWPTWRAAFFSKVEVWMSRLFEKGSRSALISVCCCDQIMTDRKGPTCHASLEGMGRTLRDILEKITNSIVCCFEES